MGGPGPRSLVFDAGPLIALDKGDTAARGFLRRTLERGWTIVVPAAVLAQVWRDPRRQARLAGLIASETTSVDVLDSDTAKAVGLLCKISGTSDVVEASVVLSARLRYAAVVTSDASDLRRIDPSIEMDAP